MTTLGTVSRAEPTRSKAVLRLRNVSLTYDSDDEEGIWALDKLTLEVIENEFLVIVGPSGCGKSTLLKLMVGLLRPTDGEVLYCGTQIKDTLQDVGMVYQSPLLLPWRNVLDNVMLPIEILHLDRNYYLSAAKGLLDTVGLSDFSSVFPRQLSGGMRQRVALCRALINDPTLLLMDEPFAALDPLMRDEMAQELAWIWEQRKKTVVFVTHGIDEAVMLADRIIVMSPRPGRIAEEIRIDLPRPRREARRNSAAFSAYVERIRDIIFSFKQATPLPASAIL